MSTRVKFDIKYQPEIEAGTYTVETADGRSVSILKWDCKNDYPIVGVVTNIDSVSKEESEEPRSYNLVGEDSLQDHVAAAFNASLVDTLNYAKDYRSHAKSSEQIAAERSESLIQLAGKDLADREKNNLWVVIPDSEEEQQPAQEELPVSEGE